MSFAQTEYLPFLIAVVCLWPFVAARWRAAFLLFASFTFYVWVRPEHAPLLVLSILVDYGIGRALGEARSSARRKLLLWTSVVFNVSLLAFFKYAVLLVHTWAGFFGPQEALEFGGWALPLGISFYTFQTLSYTIDVYAGRQKPCRNLVDFALYVSFFPQLVAGPIERAGHLLPQLRDLRTLEAANVSLGARRILWGLAKKWIVADRLLFHIWPMFENPGAHDSLTLLAVVLGLSAVIYLDFSAYTDIAIGTARLFNIRLVENFDRPFLATSIEDYVKRWHMSLARWMFDYVFDPLSRRMPTHWRIWRNNLLVLGLFGLWHGAAWTFLAWGACFGVAVSLRQSSRLARTRHGVRRSTQARNPLRSAFAWAVCISTSSQIVVLFFSPSIAFAAEFYTREMRSGFPDSSQFGTLAGLCLTLTGLFVVHASGTIVKWDLVWARIGTLGRALTFAVGIAAAVLWRVSETRPFIYFEF